jgi:hypothetical protein
LTATHSRSAARLSSEPQCELSTRVCFVEQINSGPHRGDSLEKIPEQVVSRDHADLSPVIGQSALAALGTPQEDLTDYWGQLRAVPLITQAHRDSLARRSS